MLSAITRVQEEEAEGRKSGKPGRGEGALLQLHNVNDFICESILSNSVMYSYSNISAYSYIQLFTTFYIV